MVGGGSSLSLELLAQMLHHARVLRRSLHACTALALPPVITDQQGWAIHQLFQGYSKEPRPYTSVSLNERDSHTLPLSMPLPWLAHRARWSSGGLTQSILWSSSIP